MADTTPTLGIREILPSYDTLPDLLTTKEVAALLGIRPNTLPADRCGAHRYAIPYVRVGRRIRYPKTQIAQWLLSNAHGL